MKTVELNPNKNYILGYHPHGIMSTGAFATFGTDSCGFMEVFPGVKPTLAVLAGLFMIPIFREYIMSGGTSVSALQCNKVQLSFKNKTNVPNLISSSSEQASARSVNPVWCTFSPKVGRAMQW